ncbi:MAG TPA: Holliday junction resolvase RuvX [Solirubrobacteraceae bacterium]|nr:Holliday junction resolvase RuvX [Solirubrobacteraceae bacterium]
MRALALDHGAARCGVAVSDPTGTLATPVGIVERPDSRRGLDRIVALAREHDAAVVVVGLPLSLSGGDSAQTGEARAFAEKLRERLDIPIELYDERFTTTLAARVPGGAAEDARAAAVLLEGWLEAHA